MRECGKTKKEIIDEAIEHLPNAQKEAVKMIFEMASKKGPSGMRYTIEWVYECMLMRIKSRKLYEHLRTHHILPLPCETTIKEYLKHYSGAYGFQPSTFEMLKKKTEEMPDNEKHGCILIDEMKLTPGIQFDSSSLKVEGFVDLGEESLKGFGEELHDSVQEAMQNLPSDPEQEKKRQLRKQKQEKNQHKKDKKLGDHALVVTFQPFRGRWVQNLGCFLTKNNANDEQLTKLVLEAVLLVESSGLYVDAVVTDGATWNRAMWTKFGVNEDNPSAQHPSNPERKLFFISDYPHLLKCMRNCFLDKKVIDTPKGPVKLEHWKAVLEADSIREVGLRECPKLTEETLQPDNWSKMKCGLAWQFWSQSSAAGMQSYRYQGVEKLEDCDASVELCQEVNQLSDAMNSRIPSQALKPNSPQTNAIETFLKKLEQIQAYQTDVMQTALLKAEEARLKFVANQGRRTKSKVNEIKKKRAYVFSESTDVGLKVTLKGTLALLTYLTEKCQFKYLMTARLNQDALERFFGLMRQSCGPNTHPEPRVFAQLFRLLSIYSLVKPIKGSNITGGEMLTTLLNLDDLQSKTKTVRKEELHKRLDEIVLEGENLDHISHIMEAADDHNYIDESIDEFALSYVGGFAARKSAKFTNGCEICEKALKKTKSDATDVDMLINLKSRGYLTYPSDELLNLLRILEKEIVKTCKQNEMEENILFLVVEKLENLQGVPLVGCDEHRKSLSKAVMKFYLIMRMHFVCKRWNKANEDQKKKQKGLRKLAHLT